MKTFMRTLTVGVIVLSVAMPAGATLVTPSETTTGAGEFFLWDIYNRLYGTALTSNAGLVSSFGLDTQVIPVSGLTDFEIEAAWMNAYFTQDIGVYTDAGGAPDFSVLAPVPWGVSAVDHNLNQDLRGQGFIGSYTASQDFFIADHASHPNDGIAPLSPGGPTDNIDMFTWYSEDSRNLLGNAIGWNVGDPHIIFFSTPTPGTYLAAIEDLPLEHPLSHSDYNDFLIEIRTVVVPEPATMVLLGLGLAGLAIRKTVRS